MPGGFTRLYDKSEIMQKFLFVYPKINGIMKREKRRPDMKRITLNLLLFANSILLIMYMALAINRNMVFNTTGIVSLNLSSLILIDITYISSCNVRETKSSPCFAACWHSIASAPLSACWRQMKYFPCFTAYSFWQAGFVSFSLLSSTEKGLPLFLRRSGNISFSPL